MDPRVKGCYTYDTADCRKMDYLYNNIRKYLRQRGFKKQSHPRIGLMSDFQKEKEHFKLNSEVFKLESGRTYLSATGESVMYPAIYHNKQLIYPLKWYDLGPVWRNQTKATKKYFRGSQISFFLEAHAILTKENEAKDEFEQWIITIKEFFNEIGLSKVKIVERPPEDKFNGAERTVAFDYTLGENEIQIASIHYLGSNFNDAYNNSGAKTYGYCWGFSERILGVLKKVYGQNYYHIFDQRPLLVYYDSKLDLKEVAKRNVYDYLTQGYVKLNDFNPTIFMKQERVWNPTFTLKIGSLEELKGPLKFRFIPTKKDVNAEEAQAVYAQYGDQVIRSINSDLHKGDSL